MRDNNNNNNETTNFLILLHAKEKHNKKHKADPSSSCCIEPSAINVDAMKCGRNESETNNIVKIKDAKITN